MTTATCELSSCKLPTSVFAVGGVYWLEYHEFLEAGASLEIPTQAK
jgi:hypothetical protein